MDIDQQVDKFIMDLLTDIYETETQLNNQVWGSAPPKRIQERPAYVVNHYRKQYQDITGRTLPELPED